MATAAMVVAMLAACGGGGGGGYGSSDSSSSAASYTSTTAPSGNGTLRMALTDAPSCGFDAVNITIQSLRVNQSSTAGDNDAGWSEVTLNPAMRVNLLTLTNGVLTDLGQMPLPAGKYTQLRLILADNDGTHPLANSVLPTGGTETALKTPSGQQSGVKANINIDVAAGQMADFVLDFDACKSVVTAGNSGQYLLKPVVTVVPRMVTGVSGVVAGTLATGTTTVSLQQGGAIVKATAPNAQGMFLLQPVAAGSYTLVVTAPGHATAVVTGVTVAAGAITTLNTSTNPLNAPTSPTGTVQGMAPVNTAVRAMQSLTAGPTIEVAGKFVDGVTGAYSFTLPTDAPQVAPSPSTPSGTLTFTADTAVAGKYQLGASLTGFADKTVVLPALTAGATLTTNFTFP
jgi:hypothetical protein